MATVGDTVSGLSSVTDGTYLDLLPVGTEEWVIHNISIDGGSMELHFYDGTLDVACDVAPTTQTMYANMALHCTASRRYRVKNVTGSAKRICYDGVITRV